MMKKHDVVYESPDNGNTVYARKLGETVIHSIHIDPKWLKEQELYHRWERLKPAVYMADNDPTLNDAISKVEMLYALKKTQK